jgi:hypothetical protein
MSKVICHRDAIGHGDPRNAAVFGTRFEFPEMHVYSNPDWKHAPAGPEVQSIREMGGIESLAVYKHNNLFDLCVVKCTAWTWDEIEPKITALLEARHDRLEKSK